MNVVKKPNIPYNVLIPTKLVNHSYHTHACLILVHLFPAIA